MQWIIQFLFYDNQSARKVNKEYTMWEFEKTMEEWLSLIEFLYSAEILKCDGQNSRNI